MNTIQRLSGLVALLLALVLFSTNAQPAAAQNNTWKSQFFDNPYLIGDIVRTEFTQGLAFNWGSGSPDGVPEDNFSARITTDVWLEPGNYRFWILADDGIGFRFDFQQRLNTYFNTQPGEIQQVDISVTQPKLYHFQVDYREVTANAYVYFDYTNMSTNPRGPNFPANVNPTPVPGGTWQAEYFTNNDLSGSPVSIVSDNGPNQNWGVNSPALSLPADNFSVRWTTQQFFDGGVYQLSVRADDGVRVYFDNILYIDQWQFFEERTFTANVQLAPGFHNIRVDYREFTQNAYIEYALTRFGNPNPIIVPTTVAPTVPTTTPNNLTFNASVTVVAFRLNVRNAPSADTGMVLTQITRGESYPLIGRTADLSWYQINVNGTIGWVSAGFVNSVNVGAVPVVSGSGLDTFTPTGFTLTTTANLNVRTDDSLSGTLIGRIPRGNSAQILARNASNTWYYVRYSGLDGWVSAGWVSLGSGTDSNRIPIQ